MIWLRFTVHSLESKMEKQSPFLLPSSVSRVIVLLTGFPTHLNSHLIGLYYCMLNQSDMLDTDIGIILITWAKHETKGNSQIF